MTSDDIRKAFLRFFEERKHKVIPSSSLIPQGDPTLLLTTAGMVQIKPYFLGLAVPPAPRLASCQKCFRTTDIDAVGDAKHLTLFEMLGNFSVGDYFKKEAIAWGWEFITKRLEIPDERLWVTIYLDDNEAFDCWRKIGFPENKIVRLDEKDNFWGPPGDSGPCGPCSEIHYDFGEQVGCGKPACGPACDCERFSEIWNLVFMQYNQDCEGKRMPLPKPNIDTGMGLERVSAVMQGVSTVYDTDLFLPLRNKVSELSGKEYGKSDAFDQAIRIVIEHSRGVAFLVADGVLPSNEGRGYVLRRILRRACFFGKKLGIKKPFLDDVVEVVINKMGHIYPEIINNQKIINEVVKIEEGKFLSTLDVGMNLVERAAEEVANKGQGYIAGKDVFKFWDTYGFPVELTAEIARSRGLSTDFDGFEVEMEMQRERARAKDVVIHAPIASATGTGIPPQVVITPTTPTIFVGYDRFRHSSIVRTMLDQDSGATVTTAVKDQKVAIVLDETPFYGEKGGQVGDAGKITVNSSQVDVTNTVWSPFGVLGEGAIVHLGKVVKGSVSTNDKVEAEVDLERRLDVARNHTATHLLQAALRQVLGTHVQQRGSLVAPDRLRFDFSHLTAISKQQLIEIQQIVNEKIRQNLPVKSRETSHKQAIADGAIALFDEKYGDTVRVMEIGEPLVSAELCGGTHVKATGEIGLLLVVSESSIGASLRRIEAVTGRNAEQYLQQHFEALGIIAAELKSTPMETPDKVKALIAELAAEHKRLMSLEREQSINTVDTLLKRTEQINGITVLAAEVPSTSMNVLREIGDLLKEQLKSGVIVLGTVYENKPAFMAAVTSDLLSKGLHAGEIVKQVAAVTGGGGGGKATMAQAGGKDKSKLTKAIELVRQLVQKAG